jgi:BMFP domain-containing protein YqiC
MAGSGSSGDGKRGLFDDLAGMAGGAFSVVAALRQEAESMARSQVEAMVAKFELVRREELDAALEVARRAREQAEALAHRLQELEARVAALESPRDEPAGADELP